MLRVEPENERGAEMVVSCAAPAELVERILDGRLTVRLVVEAVVE